VSLTGRRAAEARSLGREPQVSAQHTHMRPEGARRGEAIGNRSDQSDQSDRSDRSDLQFIQLVSFVANFSIEDRKSKIENHQSL
jgi:hypothetical protein